MLCKNLVHRHDYKILRRFGISVGFAVQNKGFFLFVFHLGHMEYLLVGWLPDDGRRERNGRQGEGGAKQDREETSDENFKVVVHFQSESSPGKEKKNQII